MEDPAPTREQFLMWGLETAAMGTCGLFYWSGNRWRGGHWPHWGGLLDWSGHPEPDFDWAVELGKIFARWGKHLIDHPVKATAAVLTDFEQRAALDVYPHVKGSNTVLPECFQALHRLGMGVDSVNLASAADASNLKKYSLVLIPAATALDDPQVTVSLQEYVQGGGMVIITPFTSYVDRDGIFRGDGFAANLWELTRCVVRTVRWMGYPGWKAKMGSWSSGSAAKTRVEWKDKKLSDYSWIGLEGFCEFLEVDAAAESIAFFKSDQAILDGRPAVTQRKLGKGSVLKLGFWPGNDALMALIQLLAPAPAGFLAKPVPEDVIAVPHTDNSLFVVNTSSSEADVHLTRTFDDRLSGATVPADSKLQPYHVWWLV
jgi:beta-galactosidase GanA